jgi:2-dehydro-3-deoxyphosphooctonate aldolase (KDO 8-P synthase)
MVIIAGPCVLESEQFALDVAGACKEQLKRLPPEIEEGIDYYFKGSFDKANRTSVDGFRGPGLEKGLKILQRVQSELGLKVFTDFHEAHQAEPVASVVDFIQVPAMLSRQTDMIVAAARAAQKYSCKLNVKKGQFLAPADAHHIVQKVCQGIGKTRVPEWLFLTERGTSFGYNTLVVDMTSFEIMKTTGAHILHDATHSLQLPSAAGKSSGGKRQFLEPLARAALAAGAQGIFLECHPRPSEAKSDAATCMDLAFLSHFIADCWKVRQFFAQMPYQLPYGLISESLEAREIR